MDINKLIKFRNLNIIIDKLIELILQNKGLYLPRTVKIGKKVIFPHNGVGTVIHPNTIIKDNVKIYQNVTIGRADIYNDIKDSKFEKIIIEEGAIICAGAKVLCKKGTLIIGKNTIVAANAVLTESTGEHEVWAGIPAKRLKKNSKKKN